MFRPSAYNISWSWACSSKQWITSAIDLLDFLDCKLGNGFRYKKTSVSGETSQNNFLESKSILLPSCWPIFDGHASSDKRVKMTMMQFSGCSRFHETVPTIECHTNPTKQSAYKAVKQWWCCKASHFTVHTSIQQTAVRNFSVSKCGTHAKILA